MRRIIVLLFVVVASLTASAADYNPTDKELDELLKYYKLYELPLPSAEYKLVRMNYGLGTKFKGITYTPAYQYGFAKTLDSKKVIVGLEEIEPKRKLEFTDDNALDEKLINTERWEDIWDGANVLLLAIQCHARGHTKLAKAILKRAARHKYRGIYYYYNRSIDRALFRKANTQVRFQLVIASNAYIYRLEQLRQEGSDWQEIEKKLTLIAKSPYIPSQKGLEYSLRTLRASLAPRTSTPGTIEFMIDNLVDAKVELGAFGFSQIDSAEYLTLLEQGFDAIPTLVKYLDDDRKTRSVTIGFNNFRTHTTPLNVLVQKILWDMSVGALEPCWLKEQTGNIEKREVFENWWKDAQKIGEREWMLNNLTYIDKDNGVCVSRGPVRILAHKYPDDLELVVKKIIELKPNLYADILAAAILDADISIERKEKLTNTLIASSDKINRQVRNARYLIALLKGEKINSHFYCRVDIPIKTDTPLHKAMLERQSNHKH